MKKDRIMLSLIYLCFAAFFFVLLRKWAYANYNADLITLITHDFIGSLLSVFLFKLCYTSLSNCLCAAFGYQVILVSKDESNK